MRGRLRGSVVGLLGVPLKNLKNTGRWKNIKAGGVWARLPFSRGTKIAAPTKKINGRKETPEKGPEGFEVRKKQAKEGRENSLGHMGETTSRSIKGGHIRTVEGGDTREYQASYRTPDPANENTEKKKKRKKQRRPWT